MKRSEINSMLGNAIEFFNEMNFMLPPWATWKKSDWIQQQDSCTEIFSNKLGWDLTDFGSNDFMHTGLLLFTLRNGNIRKDDKPYAEKIMIVEEEQVTPMHYHWNKMEDIINRGGGNLCIEMYPSKENNELGSETLEIQMDGLTKSIRAGEILLLKPGESITIRQQVYHRFYGEKGKGKILLGEVSAVNDDEKDNRFFEKVGRFPEIEEDVEWLYPLVGDYKKLLSS